MSEIIPQKKDSIKILLLCSYDRDTLRIVGRLSNQIIEITEVRTMSGVGE